MTKEQRESCFDYLKNSLSDKELEELIEQVNKKHKPNKTTKGLFEQQVAEYRKFKLISEYETVYDIDSNHLFSAKVVKVKIARRCYKCSHPIQKGSTAVSGVDLSKTNRIWVCPSCFSKLYYTEKETHEEIERAETEGYEPIIEDDF